MQRVWSFANWSKAAQGLRFGGSREDVFTLANETGCLFPLNLMGLVEAPRIAHVDRGPSGCLLIAFASFRGVRFTSFLPRVLAQKGTQETKLSRTFRIRNIFLQNLPRVCVCSNYARSIRPPACRLICGNTELGPLQEEFHTFRGTSLFPSRAVPLVPGRTICGEATKQKGGKRMPLLLNHGSLSQFGPFQVESLLQSRKTVGRQLLWHFAPKKTAAGPRGNERTQISDSFFFLRE